MIIKTVKGFTPVFDDSCFIAENVVLTGDVQIGAKSSIWFNTVIRGDCNKIRIGQNVNIQDQCMVHGTTGRGDTRIGDNVSVGHRAIIHGCQIQDNVLIGMGAIVLDGTIIESNVIVAAGAVVTSNKHLKSGWLYAGTPAKPIKQISTEYIQMYIEGTSKAYIEYSKYYK